MQNSSTPIKRKGLKKGKEKDTRHTSQSVTVIKELGINLTTKGEARNVVSKRQKGDAVPTTAPEEEKNDQWKISIKPKVEERLKKIIKKF